MCILCSTRQHMTAAHMNEYPALFIAIVLWKNIEEHAAL